MNSGQHDRGEFCYVGRHGADFEVDDGSHSLDEPSRLQAIALEDADKRSLVLRSLRRDEPDPLRVQNLVWLLGRKGEFHISHIAVHLDRDEFIFNIVPGHFRRSRSLGCAPIGALSCSSSLVSA